MILYRTVRSYRTSTGTAQIPVLYDQNTVELPYILELLRQNIVFQSTVHQNTQTGYAAEMQNGGSSKGRTIAKHPTRLLYSFILLSMRHHHHSQVQYRTECERKHRGRHLAFPFLSRLMAMQRIYCTEVPKLKRSRYCRWAAASSSLVDRSCIISKLCVCFEDAAGEMKRQQRAAAAS